MLRLDHRAHPHFSKDSISPRCSLVRLGRDKGLMSALKAVTAGNRPKSTPPTASGYAKLREALI